LTAGGIQIEVQYAMNDFTNGISGTPTCSPSCSPDCIPDSVTVSIGASNPSAYVFNRFLTFFGLPTFQLPAFATTLPMESGVDPSATP
jgi:hypothetical protein